MGLFGEEDTTRRELDAKDSQIAELQRQLAARDVKETPRVAAATDEVAQMELRHVLVKLPPFSESNPALWFGKAESQFILRRITDDTTKFHHIYSLLSEKASNEIEDLLLDPPATGKVAAMKERLLQKFGRSQFSKDTELLSYKTLGDLRPSEMWSKFKQLNKDPHNNTNSFVKAWLIGMFPPEVRAVIANMSFDTNAEMAVAADKIMEMKSPSGSINAVQEDRAEEVAEIDAVYRGATRGRGGARGGRGGQHRPAESQAAKSKTCFYHDRHGPAAFKCDGAPCPFSSLPLAPKKSGNGNAGH